MGVKMVHLIFNDYGVFTLCLALEFCVYSYPRFVADIDRL